MGKWLMRLGAMVLTTMALILTGCPSNQTEKPSHDPLPTDSMPPVVARDVEQPVEKEAIPIEVSEALQTLAPKPTSIPEVKLPETLQETCLVAVGDVMPAGEVTSIDGEKKAVADMLGKQCTVVFFWTAGSSEIAEKTAAQALTDLQGDALATYGDEGLAVLAINPKDSPEKARQLADTVDIGFPVLLDNGGDYFAKIANNRLPRVYLLDASGKIVWFDVEFSEVSRETLKQALKVVLGEPQSVKE